MAEIQEKDQITKYIKNKLELWRELIIPIYYVLMWKNIPLHPGIIFGVSTLFFILILLIDPTLVSFISFVLLCVTLLDYTIPICISKIFSNESWTGSKEKKINEICEKIASEYLRIKCAIVYFFSLKNTRPKTYYAIVIPSLLFMSWLGNIVNNILLTYLVVTSALMFPGLKHNGFIKKYSTLAKQFMVQSIHNMPCKKQKKM